jgi:hypothetical protein
VTWPPERTLGLSNSRYARPSGGGSWSVRSRPHRHSGSGGSTRRPSTRSALPSSRATRPSCPSHLSHLGGPEAKATLGSHIPPPVGTVESANQPPSTKRQPGPEPGGPRRDPALGLRFPKNQAKPPIARVELATVWVEAGSDVPHVHSPLTPPDVPHPRRRTASALSAANQERRANRTQDLPRARPPAVPPAGPRRAQLVSVRRAAAAPAKSQVRPDDGHEPSVPAASEVAAGPLWATGSASERPGPRGDKRRITLRTPGLAARAQGAVERAEAGATTLGVAARHRGPINWGGTA